MKNLLYFLGSLFITSTLMVMCSLPASAQSNCPAVTEEIIYSGSVYHQDPAGSVVDIVIFECNETTGTWSLMGHIPGTANDSQPGQALIRDASTGVQLVSYSHSYFALDAEIVLAGGPQPPDCEELEGDEYYAVDTTKYSIGDPFCDPNQCEVVIDIRARNSAGDYHYVGTYTGGACESGDPEPDPPDDCPDFLSACNALCPDESERTYECDASTDTYVCQCNFPEFPIVHNPTTGNNEPDQDGDDEGSSTDTDVDGDGTSNGSDSDVDGDSQPNGQDQDTDGDGQDNRGDFTYFDNNWGTHNGYGSDNDLDGDGTTNGSDDDIDGDGILNGNDPDMDGDGVPNDSDVDADGDGLIDGSDPDSDGDGISDGDDYDPDGSNAAAADTDGDGDVDGDDEPVEEEPTEEDVEAELDGIPDNEYDGTIEGEFTDPDLGGTVQGYLDDNPFSDNMSGSQLTFSGSDSCFYFPNPYEPVTEQYCLDPYESYFNTMGLILLGLTGFMCFRIIKG